MDIFETDRQIDIKQRIAEEYNVLPENLDNGSHERNSNAFFTGLIIVATGSIVVGTPFNPIPWVLGAIVCLGHKIISENSQQARNEKAARERLQSIRRIS